MSATGILQLRAFTSRAQIPLRDVAVVITATDGTAIAMRLTDRNGLISPVEIPVPDISESLDPAFPGQPYTNVNLHARKNGYEQVIADNIQIFADTVTYQNLEMIPLSEVPNDLDQTVNYNTPPQNL